MIPAEVKAKFAPHMRAAPVDVAACAQELGLQVFSAPLGLGVSGVLVKDAQYNTPSGFAIFVDSKEGRQRQRFTAAHEIGHFVLHRHLVGNRLEDNYLLRADGVTNRQEAEANQFAADLLMPHELIQQAISNGIRGVDSLAQHFNVSKIAMGIRMGLPT